MTRTFAFLSIKFTMPNALIDAIENCSVEEVCLVLKEHPNLVNAVPLRGLSKFTPLIVAAEVGDDEIVEALINAGAEVHECCEINFEAFLSHRGSFKADALKVAAMHGNSEVLQVILAAIPPQLVDGESTTDPVILAAAGGHIEALEVLLQKHLIYSRNTLAKTTIANRALSYALYYGHVECVRSLLAHAKVKQHIDVEEGIEIYPLHQALLKPRKVDGSDDVALEKADDVVLELVKILVKAGADVNTPFKRSHWDPNALDEKFEVYPLACAAFYGRCKAARYFLDKGANMNAKDDEYKWGALHYAVASGNAETVEFFMKAGAVSQVKWKIGLLCDSCNCHSSRTALDIVGMYDERLAYPLNVQQVNDYAKIVQLLVDRGADLENKNGGFPPLHWACLNKTFSSAAKSLIEVKNSSISASRRMPVISALLQAGAALTASVDSVRKALQVFTGDVMSATQKVPKMFTLIDSTTNVQNLFTSEVAELLVNAKNRKTQETPLHLAAKLGDVEIVVKLLKAGADAHAQYKPTYFEKFACWFKPEADALDIAAAFGHVSVIEVLLEAIDTQSLDSGKPSVLDYSAIYGHLKVLEMLLAKHPSLPGSVKARALGYALFYGHIECTRCLISHGFDPNASIMLHKAATEHHSLHLAIKEHKDTSGTLIVKSDETVLKLVKMLVEAGADMDQNFHVYQVYEEYYGSLNLCFLSCALFYGRWQVANYLLSRGADINAEDNHGWGPLDFAIASGDPKAVDILVKSGAAEQVKWDINTGFDNGPTRTWSALDIIGVYDKRLRQSSNDTLVQDYLKIVYMLVDHGASLENRNEFGNTPLHSACIMGEMVAPAGCYLHSLDDSDDMDTGGTREESVHRRIPFISALLQAGANPNALNKERETPLHVLMKDFLDGIAEVTSYSIFNLVHWRTATATFGIVHELSASICSAVRLLVEAGADVNLKNKRGEKPLHALINGRNTFFHVKNNAIDDIHDEGCEHIFPNHEIDPIIVELVKWGANSWEVVPEPCHGLEKALCDVWNRGNSLDLGYLFEKLGQPFIKNVRSSLLLLNRCLPGETEMQIKIMKLALQ